MIRLLSLLRLTSIGFLLLLSRGARAEIELIQGTIEGAHYTIARDTETKWNRALLLIAHGYRPETAPLVADLFPDQAAYASLINEGWMVAKTSYRRNGIIIADAITDLDNLHTHITAQFGKPQRTIIEGDSMGGTIATLLMERNDSRYQGAIAIGAALDLREDEGATGVNLQPRHPLLFMANRSEIQGPTAYVSASHYFSENPSLRPALFRIDRDGHVNVNQAERLAALRALNLWIDRGRTALPAQIPFDATHPASPRPSEVQLDPDQRGLTAQVSHVSAIYGNVWLNIQIADLQSIGLKPGLWARLTIGEQTHRVRYGKDFSSVDRGQWVIFPNADGYFWLSRNWGNAAKTANLTVGDTVHLRRYEPGH